eukprot:CAMPEP_0116879168 /NCGR_PEP_ID=MMETSP0463-20121206/10945_1 /TAXON_ID=181622 /ORGANISM="Strombidinopsis sp, Strain SopsisLIS2011" /LENGTH=41 /DNA_ID= /DNA_START= /DNA_END= /DNA_ORIENTATION=
MNKIEELEEELNEVTEKYKDLKDKCDLPSVSPTSSQNPTSN